MKGDCAGRMCDTGSLGIGPHAGDKASGLVFCDALCWHAHYFGIRPSITMGEEIAWQDAKAWMKKHRGIR